MSLFLEQVMCAGSPLPRLTPRRLLNSGDLKEAGCPWARPPRGSAGRTQRRSPCCELRRGSAGLSCWGARRLLSACLSFQLSLNEPKARTLHCLLVLFPREQGNGELTVRMPVPCPPSPAGSQNPRKIQVPFLFFGSSLLPHFYSIFLSLISPTSLRLLQG